MENIKHFSTSSPLFQSCYMRDEEVLCAIGNLERLMEINIRDKDKCLNIASRYNHPDIIKFLISQGADYFDLGFSGACIGGHMELAHYFANNYRINCYEGFIGACIYDRLDMVKYCIELFLNTDELFNDYEYIRNGYILVGCEEASKKNNVNIIKYLIELRMAQHLPDESLYNACLHNNVEMLDYLIEEGASNFKRAINGACQGGHLELVGSLLDKYNLDLNETLLMASYSGRVEIIKYLISRGANNFECAFNHACVFDKLDVVRFYINKHYITNCTEGFITACSFGSFNVAKFLAKNGEAYGITTNIADELMKTI